MLVLSRKPGEEIQIGSQIVITVLAVRGNRVRLGIQAAGEIPIYRAELDRQLHRRPDHSAAHVHGSLSHTAEVA